MGQKRAICFWCRAETNYWVCDHLGDCLCHVFRTGEERYSCKKIDCKEKQKVWQKDKKEEETENQQEKLQETQEQNQNYQNLKKEIESIDTNSFKFWEDDEVQTFFADWKQKIVNEQKTWENINSSQSKSLKNLLSQKQKEANKSRKEYDQWEKDLVSWDNFLGIIEILKENPYANLTVLPEWEELTIEDKELTKVVQKITEKGQKIKKDLNKAKKDWERELAKNSLLRTANHWLDNYKFDMKIKGISIKDKDFNVIYDLVAEICGEKAPEIPEKKSPSPPTQHDINQRYQNDTQKDEINNSTSWQNNEEKQLAEGFLKKIIEAEIYLERNQSSPQIISELERLITKYPSIYELLNKEGRIDKAINKLKELERNKQKENSQPDNNSFLLSALIIGGIAFFLFGIVAVIIKNYSKKKKKKNRPLKV